LSKQLNFTEFVDYLLVRLYELDRERGSGDFHDAKELADALNQPVGQMWPADAVRVLIDRGWARGALAGADQAYAAIAGEGRLYVEGRQHETALIEEYRERPFTIVNVKGKRNQVAVGPDGMVQQVQQQVELSAEVRAEALGVLDEIREALRTASLNESDREEALAEVAKAERQLKRKWSNTREARELLEPLGSIAGVSSLVIKLGELLAS